MTVRDVLQRGVAVLGLLASLTVAAFNGWVVWRALATGVVRGRQGVLHLRAEGDFFYFSTVTLHVIGGLASLGLAAFAAIVLVRWKDWT